MAKANRKFRNDERGMELPINIVVMLVVGMAALAALIMMFPKAPTAMVVMVNVTSGGTGSVVKTTTDTVDFKVEVSVVDRDGNPVNGASCVLRGLGGVAAGTTGIDGRVELDDGGDFELRTNQNEANLKLTCKASGFLDHDDPSAVLVVRAT